MANSKGIKSPILEKGTIHFSHKITDRVIRRLHNDLMNNRKYRSLDIKLKVDLLEFVRSFMFSISYDTLQVLESNKLLDVEKFEDFIVTREIK